MHWFEGIGGFRVPTLDGRGGRFICIRATAGKAYQQNSSEYRLPLQ